MVIHKYIPRKRNIPKNKNKKKSTTSSTHQQQKRRTYNWQNSNKVVSKAENTKNVFWIKIKLINKVKTKKITKLKKIIGKVDSVSINNCVAYRNIEKNRKK